MHYKSNQIPVNYYKKINCTLSLKQQRKYKQTNRNGRSEFVFYYGGDYDEPFGLPPPRNDVIQTAEVRVTRTDRRTPITNNLTNELWFVLKRYHLRDFKMKQGTYDKSTGLFGSLILMLARQSAGWQITGWRPRRLDTAHQGTARAQGNAFGTPWSPSCQMYPVAMAPSTT